MDLTIVVAALAVGVIALGLLTYKLVKSLELYLIPLYAELIRKRERDHVLFEYLSSILMAKGLITPAEVAVVKSLTAAGPVTQEELEKIDELLAKEPHQLTAQEILALKQVAYKLVSQLDWKSITLGMKLLRHVANFDISPALGERQATKLEISYDDGTCTVYMSTHRKDGTVETTQGPQMECVNETLAVLRALARRQPVDEKKAEEAVGRYEKCKSSQAAGCVAIWRALSSLERKSLDILLEKR